MAESYAGFTLAEKRSIRAQIEREEWATSRPTKWGNGGDAARYVFTHISELRPQSVIGRAVAVRGLPKLLRDEIASFVATSPLGDMALRDFIQESTVDGALVVS